ncbi:MAG: hypothetical protein HY272_13525 [Gammaproteobacteria bacterium]|nr:hypothetical protein [Gammaproteobacteria bacterium]
MNLYRSERQFGLLLAAAAVLVAFWPLFSASAPRWLWLLPAATLSLIAWRVPALLTPLARAWLWLGHHLGRINTFILLSVVFFLLITPLALLFRIFRRDPLELHVPHRKSFWHRHAQAPTPESFRNQF